MHLTQNFQHDRIVVLDFETTGLSSRGDRIIEVGAVAYDGENLVGEFEQLMDPGFAISSMITGITGITNDMLDGQPSPESVMPELFKFIGSRIVIAHNAGFDRGFLHAEMRRIGIDFYNPIFCSLLLSRRLFPECEKYNLTYLKEFFQIKVELSHRALDDARATAVLWLQLMQRISYLDLKSLKCNTLSHLELLEKLSKTPKAKIQNCLSI